MFFYCKFSTCNVSQIISHDGILIASSMELPTLELKMKKKKTQTNYIT